MLLSVTALATRRSFTGFAGKLLSSYCFVFLMSLSIKKFSKFIRIKILNRLQLLQYCRIRRDRQAVFFHETKERSMMKKYYSDCTLPPTAWYGMKWKTIFPFSSIPFPFHTKNLSFHIRFRTGNFLSHSIPYFHTKKLLD